MKCKEIIDKIKQGQLQFLITNYRNNNNLAIILLDKKVYEEEGYIWDDVSVNIEALNQNEVCLDTNNMPYAEDIIKGLEVGTDTGRRLQSGYCSYPVYQIDLKKIRQYQYAN